MFENTFPEHDRMVFAEGYREGKAEGFAEGIASASRNAAIWLLENGFPPAVVARATGMQLADVLDLDSSVGTL